MTRKYAITTARILSDRALREPCGQECVDWAANMLEQGRGGRYLQMLASLAAPLNSFEVADLRDKALEEQEAPPLEAKDAVLVYARERLSSALSGDEDFLDVLADLKDLCIADGYNRALYDFYKLFFAYSDLQSSTVQWYWPGATRENIEQIVRERATRFTESEESPC